MGVLVLRMYSVQSVRNTVLYGGEIEHNGADIGG